MVGVSGRHDPTREHQNSREKRERKPFGLHLYRNRNKFVGYLFY